MKKVKLLFGLGLTMALASCQQDDSFDPNADNASKTRLVTINVAAPDGMGGTRLGELYTPSDSTNSAKGGLTNVDMTQYDIRYMMEIYYMDDPSGQPVLAVPASEELITAENDPDWNTYSDEDKQAFKTIQTFDKYQGTTFKVRLTGNRKYQVVVWADFVKQGEKGDLHYKTADGLTSIVCLDDPSVQLNDESRDAYSISKEITVPSVTGKTQDEVTRDDYATTETLVLRRPFAKVRVVTTDWYYTNMPNVFKIVYRNCKRFTDFNALTEVSNFEQLPILASNNPTYEHTVALSDTEKEYKLDYDMAPEGRTLTVDYLMTDKTDETAIGFDLMAYRDGSLILTKEFKNDIPIKRNWLTTILGNLLTEGHSFTIDIREPFIDEYTYLYK